MATMLSVLSYKRFLLSTKSSAVDMADPSSFLATTVYLPASSGYTSGIVSEQTLSSSYRIWNSSDSSTRTSSLSQEMVGFGCPVMTHLRTACPPSVVWMSSSCVVKSGAVLSSLTSAAKKTDRIGV